MSWWILGFSPDEVIVAWQDARLACACVHAWQAAGKPAAFSVLQTAGEGELMISWYVSACAAELLDAREVDWRRFITGTCAAPPRGARPALTEVGDLGGDHI